MKKGLVFLGMGFELLGLILGGLYIGRAIDHEMAWPGYGVALMVVICMASWMVHLIFLLKRFMADTDDDQASN
jgi:hypothetical protein